VESKGDTRRSKLGQDGRKNSRHSQPVEIQGGDSAGEPIGPDVTKEAATNSCGDSKVRDGGVSTTEDVHERSRSKVETAKVADTMRR